MPDVSIYVALITGGVALTPQLLVWRQNESRDKHARREQSETKVQLACEALYDATVDMETEARSNNHYHGTETAARLARIWALYGVADKAANSIAFLMPRGESAASSLADAARNLAEEARKVAEQAEEKTNLDMGAFVGIPDFGDLEACQAAFRNCAVTYLKG